MPIKWRAGRSVACCILLAFGIVAFSKPLAAQSPSSSGSKQTKATDPIPPASEIKTRLRKLACSRRFELPKDQRGKMLWLSSRDLDSRITSKPPLELYVPFAHGYFKGQAVVDVIVDSQGRVRCAEMVLGHSEVAGSILAALLKWQFTPFLETAHNALVGTLVIDYEIDTRPGRARDD
jgi:hypothetical protein